MKKILILGAVLPIVGIGIGYGAGLQMKGPEAEAAEVAAADPDLLGTPLAGDAGVTGIHECGVHGEDGVCVDLSKMGEMVVVVNAVTMNAIEKKFAQVARPNEQVAVIGRDRNV